MRYLKVKWMHDHPLEPIVLLSELDEERREVRKVEIFRDGKMRFSNGDHSSNGTLLGEVPVPQDSEIAADSQFIVEPLSADEFEVVWRRALAGLE